MSVPSGSNCPDHPLMSIKMYLCALVVHWPGLSLDLLCNHRLAWTVDWPWLLLLDSVCSSCSGTMGLTNSCLDFPHCYPCLLSHLPLGSSLFLLLPERLLMNTKCWGFFVWSVFYWVHLYNITCRKKQARLEQNKWGNEASTVVLAWCFSWANTSLWEGWAVRLLLTVESYCRWLHTALRWCLDIPNMLSFSFCRPHLVSIN